MRVKPSNTRRSGVKELGRGMEEWSWHPRCQGKKAVALERLPLLQGTSVLVSRNVRAEKLLASDRKLSEPDNFSTKNILIWSSFSPWLLVLI